VAETRSRNPLRVVGGWRHDASFRRRIGNIAHVMTGNFVGSAIALVAVGIAARTLGPHDYGVLALTITFARAIERLVSFQSWQPMIRYGAALTTADDADAQRALFKFGLLLDVAAGVAAWLVAAACLLAASRLFGWSTQAVQITLAYCTVLLFNLSGMPTAVLRLASRYRAASYGQVLSSIVRLALCAVAAWLGYGLWAFALIWMATQILGSLVFLGTGFRQLRRQGLTGVLRAPLAGVTTRFPGIWQFTWSANLSLTLRSSANQLDTLMVGALTGPAGAGLYHIAKQLGKMAQQVGTQVQAVLYPDIARLWATQALDEFRRAIIQMEVMLGAFGLLGLAVVAVFAEPALRLFAGPSFMAAAPLLTVQMVAVVLMISGTAAHSALLAMGRAKQALSVVLAATLAFHATLLVLVPRIGPMGANIAHIVLGIIWITGLAVLLRQALAADPEPSVPAGVS
jgi:O-antigen/teichoic acid export membrane protein